MNNKSPVPLQLHTIKAKNIMTKRQAQFLRHILGGAHQNILGALDSEYSEGNETGFREVFGVGFAEAERALEALRILLDKKRA